jgi:hypothetical protein
MHLPKIKMIGPESTQRFFQITSCAGAVVRQRFGHKEDVVAILWDQKAPVFGFAPAVLVLLRVVKKANSPFDGGFDHSLRITVVEGANVISA